MNEAGGHTPHILKQSIGDAELSYLLYEGDGPPLIFLHATGFTPWLWHPLARELASSYRIIAPYFCEHRPLDPQSGGLGWATLAADTVRLSAALRLHKPYLLGHSMGATVHLIAHTLYRLQATGMILIEPIVLPRELYQGPMSVDQHPLAAKAIRRTNFWQDHDEAMDHLRSRTLFMKWDEEMLELYIRHGMTGAASGGLQLACSPQHEAALFMGGRQLDPWPLLPRASCPVLLVEGESSETRNLIDLRRIQTLIPDCTLRSVEEAGHLIPMERPREVTRIIRDFFGSLRAE